MRPGTLPQSSVLHSREDLERRYEEVEVRQGHPSRLNDRLRFASNGLASHGLEGLAS